MPQRSFSATLAAAVGLLAIGLLALGVAGIHLGLLTPIAGFQLATLGMLSGVVALGLSFIGLIRTRSRAGLEGRSRAWLGAGLGALAVLLLLGGGAWTSRGSAVIHDVTTDFADPPQFSDAVRNAPDRVNGVDYPDGGESVPEQQRTAYPDIDSIDVAAPPPQATEEARRVADRLGWNVTHFDPEAGRIEATAVTRVFKFVDDVVIRVRPAGENEAEAIIDVRSNSRVGGGDLGANADRIRRFRDQLTAQE